MDAYDDDALSELAPRLGALGADGAGVGAGGIAGGPNAALGVLCSDDEPIAEVAARATRWFEQGCEELGLRHDGIARIDVQEERYEELELAREPDRFVGVSEIAQLLGVSRQRVMQLRQRDDFPEPVAELAAGPVWRMFNLQRFIAEWPRKPGRPKKSA